MIGEQYQVWPKVAKSRNNLLVGQRQIRTALLLSALGFALPIVVGGPTLAIAQSVTSEVEFDAILGSENPSKTISLGGDVDFTDRHNPLIDQVDGQYQETVRIDAGDTARNLTGAGLVTTESGRLIDKRFSVDPDQLSNNPVMTIDINGDLTITGFGQQGPNSSNQSYSAVGGAIRVRNDSYDPLQGSDLVLSGDGRLTLSNNVVRGGAAGDYDRLHNSGVGGAVFSDGNVTLSGFDQLVLTGNKAFGATADGEFSNAEESGLGGAIAASGDIVISNVGMLEVSENLAQGGGVTGGDFSSATDSGRGGAFHTSGDMLVTGGSGVFSDNQARSGSAVGGGDTSLSAIGGAIYADSFRLESGNGYLFQNNMAVFEGATLDNNFNGAEFGQGGAIATNTGSIELTDVRDIRFIRNSADGGTVDAGTAMIRSTGLGGALLSNASISFTNAEGVLFQDNKALGVRVTGRECETSVSDSALGGAVFTREDFVFDHVNNVLFLNNAALAGDMTILPEDCVGDDCFSSESGTISNVAHGGAISTSTLTVDTGKGYRFENNQSVLGTITVGDRFSGHESALGGAIAATGSRYNPEVGYEEPVGKIDISGVDDFQFISNRADTGSIIADNVVISHTGHGGATYSNQDTSITDANSFLFKDNQAVGPTIEAHSVTINDAGHGGAIYSAGDLTLDNANSFVFSGNAARFGNLTIPAEDCDGDFCFSSQDGQLANVARGGAIFASTVTINTANGYRFENNQAVLGNATVKGTLTVNGSAHGGAIAATGWRYNPEVGYEEPVGKIDIRGVDDFQFISNRADTGSIIADKVDIMHTGLGGAIYSNQDISITDANAFLFKDNEAVAPTIEAYEFMVQDSGQGGAIYSERDVILDNSNTFIFSGNSARSGDLTIVPEDCDGDNCCPSCGDIYLSRVARGGAIFASAVTIGATADGASVRDYLFENNVAALGNVTTDVRLDGGLFGSGGAIAADAWLLDPGIDPTAGSINISDAYNFQFIRNRADGGLVVADKDLMISSSGQGGALYSALDTSISDASNFLFEGNQAIGTSLRTQNGQAFETGKGGAIYAGDTLRLDDVEGFAFRGNVARGGNAIAVDVVCDDDICCENGCDGAEVSNSGQGGAIYAGRYAFGDAKSFLFENNVAQGGDVSGGGLASKSGLGGAIFADFDAALDLSNVKDFVFRGNQAIGGKRLDGTGGVWGSGLGGALYILGWTEMDEVLHAMPTIIAGSSFYGNSATTQETGDFSSGRGGAVFIDTSCCDNWVQFKATEDDPIIFAGNWHDPGNTGNRTSNAIYIGSTLPNAYPSAESKATVDFHTEGANADIYMLDGIVSQERGLMAPGMDDECCGTFFDTPHVTVNKTGEGTMYLGGFVDLRGPAEWHFKEGTMHLIRGSDGAPTRIQLSDSGPTFGNPDPSNERVSIFTSAEGTRMLLTPEYSPYVISANDIDFNANVSVTGYLYGAVLGQGRHEVLKLEDYDQSTFNNSDQHSAATSGQITVGAYTYTYDRAYWESQDTYVLNVTSSTIDPGPGGTPILVSPIAIGLLNPANRVVFNHMNTRFEALLSDKCAARRPDGFMNDSARAMAMEQGRMSAETRGVMDMAKDYDSYSCYSDTSIWITPNYTYMNHDRGGDHVAYELNMPSVTMGIDHFVTDRWNVGMAGTLSHGDLDGTGSDVNADVFTVAVYSGILLPHNIELGLQGSYTRGSFDYKRNVYGGRYSGDFDADYWHAGFEVGRSFEVAEGLKVRPWASYEIVHMDIGGFSEHGSQGDYALQMKDHDETIHRVWAGVSATQKIGENGFFTGEAYYLGFYGDTMTKSQAVFVNDPGNNWFTTYGKAMDQHVAGIGFRTGYQLNERWDASIGYDLKIGAHTQAHHGALTLRYSW